MTNKFEYTGTLNGGFWTQNMANLDLERPTGSKDVEHLSTVWSTILILAQNTMVLSESTLGGNDFEMIPTNKIHPSKHCERVDLRDPTSRGRQARQGKSEAKQHNIKTRQAEQLSNPEGPGGELATLATSPLPSASHIAYRAFYRRRRSDWKGFRLPKVQTTWCPRNFQTSFHGCSQDFKQVFTGIRGILPQHGNLIFTPICVSLLCPLLNFLFWWQWTYAFCVPVPNLVIPKKTSRNGNRNPRWSNLRALFKWSLWKETCDDHWGFRLPFQRPFWVSSCQERAVCITTVIQLLLSQPIPLAVSFEKLETKAPGHSS